MPHIPEHIEDTIPVEDLVGNLVNQPSLPPGTEIVPELLEPGADEFLQPAPVLDTGLAATAPIVTAPGVESQFDVGGAVQDVTAPQLDVDAQTAEVLDPNAQQAAQFEASLLTPEQIESALVSTELSKLLDFEAGDVPKEFKGAVLEATAAANARGLGSSTIAAEAIAAGLVNAALPIAQGNSQIRLSSMLSNQAAERADKSVNTASSACTSVPITSPSVVLCAAVLASSIKFLPAEVRVATAYTSDAVVYIIRSPRVVSPAILKSPASNA